MKKQLLFLALLILTTKISFAQTGTIKGVITYYFNQNYGFKPDVGAKISVLSEANYKILLQKVDSCLANIATYESNLILAKDLMDKSENELNALSPFTKSKKIKEFKDKYEASKRNYEKEKEFVINANMCRNIVFDKFQANANDFEKTIADGSGNYSFKLEPGNYGILLSSKQKIGNIIKGIIIKENKDTDFSYQFDKLYDFSNIK